MILTVMAILCAIWNEHMKEVEYMERQGIYLETILAINDIMHTDSNSNG